MWREFVPSMKYWCSYFVDLTQKQNSQVIQNPIMDEEFEKYCTVFLSIIQLEDYIRTFLFSYRVFQDRLDRKKSQQTLLQLTMDIINKGNVRREFCSNGIICSSAIQFLSTTGKKKNPKKQKPQTLFYSIALLSTSRRENVDAIFTILDWLCFSQMHPFQKRGVFLSLKICISTPFLVTLVTYISWQRIFQNYFHSHSN